MYPYSELQQLLQQELAAHRGTPIQDVAKRFLSESFYKKLAPSGLSEAANAAALKKFLEVDSGLPETFDTTDPKLAELWCLFKGYLGLAVDRAWGERSLREVIHSRLAIGPGSSKGVDSRSFYTKLFNGPLSCTNPFLYDLYRSSMRTSATFREAEGYRLAHCQAFRIVPGNSLFFVPKNTEISRTAATEPLLNLMVQMALGTFLVEEVLPGIGIRLAHQQFLNRTAALDASASGKMCTIDLSSASDCCSLALVQAALKGSPLLSGLMASRSPVTILPDGTEHRLRMVSSMGNGFTFPLETLIFACAVKACYAYGGFRHERGDRDYFVFGDDIICRREVFEDLIAFLGFLGFKVNASKTFSEGPFRESCGVDAWEGTDVRGVYITSLETDHHIYSAFNRLSRWSAIHQVPLTRVLERLLKDATRLLIPFAESDSAGFKVPQAVFNGRGGLYGRRVYRMLKFCAPGLMLPKKIVPSRGTAELGRLNAAGLEFSFIGGYLGSATEGWKMPIRPHQPDRLWHPRTSFTFHWEWMPEVWPDEFLEEFWWLKDRRPPSLDRASFQRWKTLVAYAFNIIA